jgi:hypothetical protein
LCPQLFEWMHWISALYCIPWFYYWCYMICSCILPLLGDGKCKVVLRCFLVDRCKYAHLLVLWETICVYPFSFFHGMCLFRSCHLKNGRCIYCRLWVPDSKPQSSHQPFINGDITEIWHNQCQYTHPTSSNILIQLCTCCLLEVEGYKSMSYNSSNKITEYNIKRLFNASTLIMCGHKV